jgi:hypothetical protein
MELEDGGFDEVLIGNICASFIYFLWEDKYRSDFAKVRRVEKNAIKSEFFKELGTYRHVATRLSTIRRLELRRQRN